MLNRRQNTQFKKLIFILLIFVFLGLGFLGYKTVHFLGKIGVNSIKKITTKPKTTYTVALLGYGGGSHEGAYLTDTLIIAHINFESQKAILMSLPRDLWVKLPTKSGEPFAAKINSVYQLQLFPATYPDVNVKKFNSTDKNGLLKKVLRDITGQDIDSYLAIDFQAFQTIIDTLGGVDINIDTGFTDAEYPIEGKEADLCGKEEKDLPELEKIATESPVLAFPCRYETVSFQAGTTHLNGEAALKYARSRHSVEDGGDFNRAKRQQKLIEAVAKKLLSPIMLTKVPTLLDKLEPQVKTDANYNNLTRLIKEAPKASQYKLKKLILSDDNYLKMSYSDDGQYILIPKTGMFQWKEIQKTIRKMTTNKVITPTPQSK